MNRDLTDYIEARDQVDDPPIPDKDMVKIVAFMWLTPWEIFHLGVSSLLWKLLRKFK